MPREILFWPIGILLFSFIFSYVKAVINSSANGEKELPGWPELTDFWENLVVPFFQYLLINIGCFVTPFIVGGFVAGLLGPQFGLAIFVVFISLGILMYPMAILAVSLFDTVTVLVRFSLFVSIIRIPAQYFFTCGFLFLIILMAAFGDKVAGAIPLPGFVSLFVVGLLSFYFVIVQARVLGLMYYYNRKRLGWF